MMAGSAAALVFGLWYPYPYQELSGGLALFWIVVSVDLVCGPLLTLVLYSPSKPRAELMRDLGLVGLIQLAALVYGIWAVAEARPVYLVYESDRFRVVSAAEIDPTDLLRAAGEFRLLGYRGPRIIAAQVPKSGDADFMQSLQLSLHGLEPALRPRAWRPYGEYKETVLGKAGALAQLMTRYPERMAELEALAARAGLGKEQIGYLPVQGRTTAFWTALIAMDDARVIGFIALDSLEDSARAPVQPR